MKKFISLVMSLSIGTTQCMYYGEYGKLKYDEITLTNKSPLLLKLSWMESSREGKNHVLSQEIAPGQTITVKLGQLGGYRIDEPAKITWRPTSLNESLKQEFKIIDLPNSKAFAFTAVTLADIMKDIWIPGMFTADDKGNFSKFQYMNIQYIDQILKQLYEVRQIK